MTQKVIAEVRKEDPVEGEWSIRRSQEGVIWCDASSLALGGFVGDRRSNCRRYCLATKKG